MSIIGIMFKFILGFSGVQVNPAFTHFRPAASTADRAFYLMIAAATYKQADFLYV